MFEEQSLERFLRHFDKEELLGEIKEYEQMKTLTNEEQEVDKQLFASEHQEDLHPDFNRFSVL